MATAACGSCSPCRCWQLERRLRDAAAGGNPVIVLRPSTVASTCPATGTGGPRTPKPCSQGAALTHAAIAIMPGQPLPRLHRSSWSTSGEFCPSSALPMAWSARSTAERRAGLAATPEWFLGRDRASCPRAANRCWPEAVCRRCPALGALAARRCAVPDRFRPLPTPGRSNSRADKEWTEPAPQWDSLASAKDPFAASRSEHTRSHISPAQSWGA